MLKTNKQTEYNNKVPNKRRVYIQVSIPFQLKVLAIWSPLLFPLLDQITKCPLQTHFLFSPNTFSTLKFLGSFWPCSSASPITQYLRTQLLCCVLLCSLLPSPLHKVCANVFFKKQKKPSVLSWQPACCSMKYTLKVKWSNFYSAIKLAGWTWTTQSHPNLHGENCSIKKTDM